MILSDNGNKWLTERPNIGKQDWVLLIRIWRGWAVLFERLRLSSLRLLVLGSCLKD